MVVRTVPQYPSLYDVWNHSPLRLPILGLSEAVVSRIGEGYSRRIVNNENSSNACFKNPVYSKQAPLPALI